MNSRRRRGLYTGVICGLVVATSLLGSYGMGGAARAAGSPTTAKFSWGTFTLASRIADKVAHHQPINAIVSFQALGVTFAVPELNAGMQRAAAQM